jgi:AcrR family transcriptional regulator
VVRVTATHRGPRNGIVQSGAFGNARSSRRAANPRPGGRVGHAHVVAMQRSRLLSAAVGSVAELGWDGASIGRITERAGVSRRTFYEQFDNREECLIAVLENAVAQITAQIAEAGLAELLWRERVRAGLWTILCHFDREPALARVCLVESRRGGGMVLDYRQEIIELLVEIVDQGRGEARANEPTALAAHGVVGGVFEVLYSQLLRGEGEPLRGLLGELTGMIVLPYLGVAASQREETRPVPEQQIGGQPEREGNGRDLLAALPMRLTYRTATVLQALEERPGQSNREVADLVGISDQGQISKLLSRLARLGLLVNGSDRGERNAWTLTATGSRVTGSIKSYAQQGTGHVAGGEVEHAF